MQQILDDHLTRRKTPISHIQYKEKKAYKKGFLTGMAVTALIAVAILLATIKVIIDISS